MSSRIAPWLPLLIPAAILIGVGLLIDSQDASGWLWLPVYLGVAALAGYLNPYRRALLLTLLTSLIVVIGAGITADDQASSSFGGRFPIVETLLIVTLPMMLFTWIGTWFERRRHPDQV